jgi:hypothetical protein
MCRLLIIHFSFQAFSHHINFIRTHTSLKCPPCNCNILDINCVASIMCFLTNSDWKRMPELLVTLCLSNALAIFLGCRPRTLKIPFIEKNGLRWIVIKMKQCLLASSRLNLELLTSYRILFILTIISCYAKAIFVGIM